MGYMVARDRAGYSAACSLLNLIPGVFGEDGACSSSADGARNATVCEAIAASGEASGRLRAGRSVLSVFLEPGTCAELQGGACWESREGNAVYEWDSLSMGHWDSWCTSQVPVATPALWWSLACPSEGGLGIRAKWVDGNAADSSSQGQGACSRDYPGGLRATLGVDGWTAGSDGSPRWRCFDVPREDMGPSDARILVYSIGNLPCVAPATTTAATSGGSSTRLAALAHAVAAAAAAVGTIM